MQQNEDSRVHAIYYDPNQSNYGLDRELLANGWVLVQRGFDGQYFRQVIDKEALTVAVRGFELMGRVLENLTRSQYSFISNVMTLRQNTIYAIEDFWNFITPPPLTPNYQDYESITAAIPGKRLVSRNTIAVEEAYAKLQETIILKILNIIGTPDFIRQHGQNTYYFPLDAFTGWSNLHILAPTEAYWEKHDIWLHIIPNNKHQKQYTLSGEDLTDLSNKACYNLAIVKTGSQVKVGELNSEFLLKSFPYQNFTEICSEAILKSQRTSILVHGEPGTGKTTWTQAFAKEFLVPLGYVFFILDKQSVLDFSPPSYLNNVCLIINDCDNLAPDRGHYFNQSSSATEHVLSLLDGTLYNSVSEEFGQTNRLVVLMTCNTTKRLDPAMLRKGRIDLIEEFDYKFV